MQQLKVKKRTAPKTLSEKIHEQLAPRAVKDADDSGDEDTRPRFSEFDENDVELERVATGELSDFRKRNVAQLDSVNSKYQGLISSRKEVFGDSEDTDDSDDDDSEQNSHQQPGAFVRLNPHSESDEEMSQSDEEEGSFSDEDNFDDENDFSLSDLAGNNNGHVQQFLKNENQQESVQKGVCVQNQLKLWERLLEIRIKLQPSLITANSFPREAKFTRLSEDAKFKETSEKLVKTVESTLQNLLELQEVLSQRFPESKNILKSGVKRKLKSSAPGLNDRKLRLSNYESAISENFSNQKQYRNDVIQKWHDRTKASGNIKNAQQSLDITKKIDNALLAKDELIQKTQLYRGGFELFDKPATQQQSESDGQDEPEPIYDGEIFDDSDFYHALLRELIEYKSNTTENPQEISAKLSELQKLRSKMKKQVDTRASKGRKIRYVVHKKLVNFTAPEDNHQWTDEAKDELFASLFGGPNGAQQDE
ncbi:protein Aatf-like [Wyeomyia smithii]|uniref:protein Aatf-like n=1 Tax=Wyeomyia smithii TaxID=174621 RepID=UPI0024680F94|nr:protein Aatf-like [Wyeomyia smithii]XP_055542102.1 protein Aatf-like [Wyeomyia smithii]